MRRLLFLWLAVALLFSCNSASAAFSISHVDGNSSTLYMAQVLDATDMPWMLYQGPNSGGYSDLKAAHYNGFSWAVEEAVAYPNTSYQAGRFVDAVMDSSGNIHASHGIYYMTGWLRYSVRSSGGSWTNTTIDSNTSVGDYSCIGLDSQNKPGIAYKKGTSATGIKVALCTSTPCTTATNWTQYIVDTNSNVGNFRDCSIIFDAVDTPHIFYYGWGTGTYNNLKHAYFTGSRWQIEDVHSPSYIDFLSAERSGSNFYVIHTDNLNRYLKYSEYNGSSWTTVSLNAIDGNIVNDGLDMTLGPSGERHVSYYVQQTTTPPYTYALKHATCASGCTTPANWTMRDVNNFGYNPANDQRNAISVASNGTIYIAYVSGSNDNAEESQLLPELPFHVIPLLAAIALLSVYLVRGQRA